MSCQGNCSNKKNELDINNVQLNKEEIEGSEDNDIWSDETEKIIPNNDIIRSHYKQGYVDGISAGKETSLQQGFDDSYPEGAKLGISVGEILANLKQEKNDSPNFLAAKKELNITNVLNQKYFDKDLNLIKSHGLINKWEQQT